MLRNECSGATSSYLEQLIPYKIFKGGQYLPEWQVEIMISVKKTSISIPNLRGQDTPKYPNSNL